MRNDEGLDVVMASFLLGSWKWGTAQRWTFDSFRAPVGDGGAVGNMDEGLAGQGTKDLSSQW